MAWQNAFAGLLTEETGKKILAAVMFARDSAQRLRVVVDNTVPVTTTNPSPLLQGSTTTGTYRVWWDPTGAVVSMEQREIERQASLQRGVISRQKWTY